MRRLLSPLSRQGRFLYLAAWRLAEHDGLTVAGYMAFAAFTSLFPFLILLAALASFLGTQESVGRIVDALFLFLPDDVAKTLSPAVREVMTGRRGGLLTFGILATLWTASSGVEALRDALNRAYEVADWKPIWWRRLQSMVIVVAGALILFVASLAVILGPVIWRLVEFLKAPGAEAELVWTLGRYAVATAVLAAGLLALHHWLPNKDWPTRAVLPGVLLTLGLWLLGATLFSLYLGTAADYSITYGSLGGVVITLFFFYLTAVLFILGAEYNVAQKGGAAQEHSPAPDAGASGSGRSAGGPA